MRFRDKQYEGGIDDVYDILEGDPPEEVEDHVWPEATTILDSGRGRDYESKTKEPAEIIDRLEALEDQYDDLNTDIWLKKTLLTGDRLWKAEVYNEDDYIAIYPVRLNVSGLKAENDVSKDPKSDYMFSVE